jgi:hypothetical protein
VRIDTPEKEALVLDYLTEVIALLDRASHGKIVKGEARRLATVGRDLLTELEAYAS